uniref:Phytosulfokine receptor 1 n=1 Tax=Aegilops tauschii TaxID=37682 RepID=M8C4L9_AEGTA
MGCGYRGGEAANDGEKEQVVEECKQQVSVDWKSGTEDRAYCFGSEWLEILRIDVPRAVGPFQDRMLTNCCIIMAKVLIPLTTGGAFGQLARLRKLDLSVNMLFGVFPVSEGGYLAIEVLNVSFNKFTGSHPVFPGAMNLTVIDISSNAFSGGFNTTAAALCITPVKALLFSRNGFNGEILAGFGRCRMLAELSIDGSGLTGNFPSDLYTLSELRRLSLRENQLSGSLSEHLGNFSQHMHIDLSYNIFTGIIPDVFGGLRRLEFLNFASNSFSGTLPASLSSRPTLRVINLRNNSLSGEIAIDFNLLARLNILDVRSNMLSGVVPPSLMWCAELKTLNLGMNKLEGKIPESYKNLRSLSHLSLVDNGFTNLSSALRVLQYLPKLTSLVLTKNLCGGETLPMDGISGFKSIQVLVLANCALSGMIPPWLESLESLRVLDLSWNNLNGTIPLWLGNLNNLFFVDLSNNSFSGQLPESFTQIKSLISSNSLSEHASIEDFPLLFKKNSAGKGNEQHRGMDTTMTAMTYIPGEVGFAFGLLIVWNVLFFIRAWRVAYFLTIVRFFDMIYVMTVVKVNKLRREGEYKVHP